MAKACQPLDTAARHAVLAGMTVVIEYTAAQERTYTEMDQVAVGWAPRAALEREEIVRAHR
jgi:hypothetical protein